LRSVRARFIERIHAGKVIADLVSAEPVKMNARDFMEAGRFRAGQVANEDRSTNFMGAPAQTLEHRDGIVFVFWLSENAIVNCDESVGSEHNVLRTQTRRCHCLADRVQRGQLAQC
jgi:hypothetical protein